MSTTLQKVRSPRRVKSRSNAAAAHAHIANVEVVQKLRQRRIHDIQFFLRRARTDTQHRHQNEKYSRLTPMPAANRKPDNAQAHHIRAAHAAEKLRQPIIAEIERSLEERRE